MNPEIENQIRNKVAWTKLPQNVKAVSIPQKKQEPNFI